MDFKPTRLAVFTAVVMVWLSGCSALLPRREIPDQGRLPQSYSSPAGVPDLPPRWWEEFGSCELNALVEQALAENLTLRQAWARLDQAGAAAVQVGSSLYPAVTLEGGASYEHRRNTQEATWPSRAAQLRDAATGAVTSAITETLRAQLGSSSASTGAPDSASTAQSSGSSAAGTGTMRIRTDSRQFSLGLAASYELDLWGRIWAQRRAAQLGVQASREDLQTAAMTLVAEIVSRWLDILEQQAQQELLRKQLETSRTYLELVELRFRKSLVSALDVYQQRQVVASVEKQLPLTKAREQVLRHELAVLVGQPPTTQCTLGEYNLSAIPPLPKTGIPADLLFSRADIRSAYARLQSADFDVAAARADRLPALRLTGRAAYSAGELELLFDDWFANLAANLTAPLFDGFRRQAEVDRTRAVVEERLAAYRLAVLTAIREVEDALVQEREQHAYLAALQTQLTIAEDTLQQAAQRYRRGLNDYLPVLNALETTQQLTRDVLAARRDLLVFRVNLYRALGGSWTTELEAPPRLSAEQCVARAEE
ncbi:MAG: efflux transporter outer membrane subunit [Planctomycetes bacterium]|nr:efflux transporter outer membrane subunit [Planctomycetota bacterium]